MRFGQNAPIILLVVKSCDVPAPSVSGILVSGNDLAIALTSLAVIPFAHPNIGKLQLRALGWLVPGGLLQAERPIQKIFRLAALTVGGVDCRNRIEEARILRGDFIGILRHGAHCRLGLCEIAHARIAADQSLPSDRVIRVQPGCLSVNLECAVHLSLIH